MNTEYLGLKDSLKWTVSPTTILDLDLFGRTSFPPFVPREPVPTRCETAMREQRAGGLHGQVSVGIGKNVSPPPISSPISIAKCHCERPEGAWQSPVDTDIQST